MTPSRLVLAILLAILLSLRGDTPQNPSDNGQQLSMPSGPGQL